MPIALEEALVLGETRAQQVFDQLKVKDLVVAKKGGLEALREEVFATFETSIRGAFVNKDGQALEEISVERANTLLRRGVEGVNEELINALIPQKPINHVTALTQEEADRAREELGLPPRQASQETKADGPTIDEKKTTLLVDHLLKNMYEETRGQLIETVSVNEARGSKRESIRKPEDMAFPTTEMEELAFEEWRQQDYGRDGENRRVKNTARGVEYSSQGVVDIDARLQKNMDEMRKQIAEELGIDLDNPKSGKGEYNVADIIDAVDKVKSRNTDMMVGRGQPLMSEKLADGEIELPKLPPRDLSSDELQARIIQNLREGDPTQITYGVALQALHDKYDRLSAGNVKEDSVIADVMERVDIAAEKMWHEKGFDRKFGDFNDPSVKTMDTDEYHSAKAAVKVAAKEQVLQQIFDAENKITSPAQREGWSENRAVVEYRMRQDFGGHDKLSDKVVADAFRKLPQREDAIERASNILQSIAPSVENPGDTYVSKDEAAKMVASLIEKVGEDYLKETGMTREEIQAGFKEIMDHKFSYADIDGRSKAGMIRADTIADELREYLDPLDKERFVGLVVTKELLKQAGVNTEEVINEENVKRGKPATEPVKKEKKDQRATGTGTGSSGNDDTSDADTGGNEAENKKRSFWDVLEEAMPGMSVVIGIIKAVIESISGVGVREEREPRNILDKDGNGEITVEDLRGLTKADLDVDMSAGSKGKIDEKDLEKIYDRIGDKPELVAELRASLGKMGGLGDVQLREQFDRVVAGHTEVAQGEQQGTSREGRV